MRRRRRDFDSIYVPHEPPAVEYYPLMEYRGHPPGPYRELQPPTYLEGPPAYIDGPPAFIEGPPQFVEYGYPQPGYRPLFVERSSPPPAVYVERGSPPPIFVDAPPFPFPPQHGAQRIDPRFNPADRPRAGRIPFPRAQRVRPRRRRPPVSESSESGSGSSSSDSSSSESSVDSREPEHSRAVLYSQFRRPELNSFASLPQNRSSPPPRSGSSPPNLQTRRTLTIGPIIGLVTSSLARIMIETPKSDTVSITLTPISRTEDNRRRPVTVTLLTPDRRPIVYMFTGLRPSTRYAVSVEGYNQVNSSFSTMGEYPRISDRLCFAIIACNKIRYTQLNVTNRNSCVWAHLAQMAKQERVNYALHLGDQIYGDDDYEAMEQGKVDKETALNYCVFAQCMEVLKRNPRREDWPGLREELTEMYRDVYRQTWSYIPTATALANVPNIMQYDDHEIRDDLGDKPEELDLNSPTRFVCECARRAILEYQRQLLQDIDLKDPNYNPRLHNENHFHLTFGEYGLLFVDTRGAKVFNRVEGDPYPFVTSSQWDEIDTSLSHDGIFKQCKVLIFLTQIPIVFFSARMTEKIAVKADDFEGMWSYKQNIIEQTMMLNKLKEWRDQNPEQRTVVLCGGDVHLGGYTEVFKKKKFQFRQIIVGPISNKTLTVGQMKITEAAKEIGEQLNDGWSYEHFDWTNKRNYGLVRVGPPTDHRYGASIGLSLCIAMENRVEEKSSNVKTGHSKDNCLLQ